MTLPQTSPITQSKINNILWKARYTFRGTVDPSQYKDYVHYGKVVTALKDTILLMKKVDGVIESAASGWTTK